MSISVVINTYDEEANIERAIRSCSWVDEVIVVDMFSDDKTRRIAKKLGAKVYLHKRTGFVEPARNFAISKSHSDWILILDADEEVSKSLKNEIVKVITDRDADYIEIPRKNIIFNKWIKNSGWWPDYNIRLFKKGHVKWKNAIHSSPEVLGKGITLEAKEEFAIVHHHYSGIGQFVQRLNNYTSIQAKELTSTGYKFVWQDLITAPLAEFLSRFFSREGYKEGVHGLVLSLLQAFSMFIVYSKVWESENFKEQQIDLSEIEDNFHKSGSDVEYWFDYTQRRNDLLHKVKTRIKKIF